MTHLILVGFMQFRGEIMVRKHGTYIPYPKEDMLMREKIKWLEKYFDEKFKITFMGKGQMKRHKGIVRIDWMKVEKADG